MTPHEFEQYAERIGLSGPGYDYVRSARDSAPARCVDSVDKGNTIWRYPSRKLGFTVSLESSAEHGFAVQLEYDRAVLEYWEQPPRVPLTTTDLKGRTCRISYVPDFLVLFENGVQVVEVKTLEHCLEKAKTQPARWVVEGNIAIDRAASAYFSGIGLSHTTYTGDQGSRLRVENYSLLLNCRKIESKLYDLKRIARSLSRFKDRDVLTMQQLLDLAGMVDATAVVKLIDDGKLFTDVDRCRISVPNECLIARDIEAISAHFSAIDSFGTTGIDRCLIHSKALREAHQRLRALSGEIHPGRSERTLRRWRSAHRCEPNDLTKLVPNHRRKGNRHSRLPEEEKALIAESIRTYYLRPECPSILAAYGRYLLDHTRREQQSLQRFRPASYKAFRLRCLDVPAAERAQARSGRRAANAHAHPISPELKHLSPARAFERAHIDHYLCDLHVLVGDTDKPATRRPWLTGMRDEATGVIFAVSLSFRSPSSLSCLGVLRDCVRRHHRLPETLVVDNGAEFHSTYFETALATLGVAKQSRPPGHPRFGGPIEAWFHSVKAFLATQKGNTTNDQRARSASASHKGRKHTNWTIQDLHRALDEFTFQHFNHATTYTSLHQRSHLLGRSLSAFPGSGRTVVFNEDFLALTSLPLDRKLKVDPARGVRHLGRWFSSPKLFGGRQCETRLEAFQEPWDMNRLYVRFNGELITCWHGANRTSDLSIDFGPALESILFIECTDVRAQHERLRAIEAGKLAKKWHSNSRPPKPAARPPVPVPAKPSLPAKAAEVKPYGFRKRS